MPMRAALFMDRDGVINIDHGYVHRIEDFEWVPGVFATARTAAELGLALVVVTNQAGIARGYYNEAQFLALSQWMKDAFASAGAPLTDVYFCPQHPDGLPPYNRASLRRKPAPGMLLEAASDHGIDLSASVLIGDQPSDIAAGRAAGLRKVAFFGHPAEPEDTADADLVLADHAAACVWLREVFHDQSHLRIP